VNLDREFNFNVKRKRPEEEYEEASDYFKGDVLVQYANSKSIMRIQEKITIRALELLDLKKKEAIILDAGCGPGFAAIYLREMGYRTVALDLITEFLYYYDIKILNPITSDMCFPPFKPNTFDAIISISALQWIYKDLDDSRMHLKLKSLSKAFFNILKPDCRAVFQFYPKNKEIMDSIGKIIVNNTTFHGNFIIDNPNRQKKRRIFLLLNKQT